MQRTLVGRSRNKWLLIAPNEIPRDLALPQRPRAPPGGPAPKHGPLYLGHNGNVTEPPILRKIIQQKQINLSSAIRRFNHPRRYQRGIREATETATGLDWPPSPLSPNRPALGSDHGNATHPRLADHELGPRRDTLLKNLWSTNEHSWSK